MLRALWERAPAFKGLLQQPTRPMATARLLSLNDLRDNPGATKTRKILGRGPGSGLGKTCGKGHKGTWARHGLRKRGFEGGQTALWKRTPKVGHSLKGLAKKPDTVNLDKIHQWIKDGRIDPAQTITMKVIRDSGLLGNTCPKWGIKLLGSGKKLFRSENKHPLKFEVSDVSKEANDAVEATGGEVKKVWFNRVSMRAHFKPHKFPIPIKHNGIPPPKKREKYRQYMEEYFEEFPEHKERLWMPPEGEEE